MEWHGSLRMLPPRRNCPQQKAKQMRKSIQIRLAELIIVAAAVVILGVSILCMRDAQPAVSPTLHAITLPGTYDIYPGDGFLVCHQSDEDSVKCVILPPGSLIVIPRDANY